MLNSVLLALIMKYSLIYGVDPFLALSIAKVESNFNQEAIGSLGEVGVFQVRPEFYKGTDLKDLRTNVKVGIKHLAEAMNFCKNNRGYEAVNCYNFGVKAGSELKYPKKTKYYKQVEKYYVLLQG